MIYSWPRINLRVQWRWQAIHARNRMKVLALGLFDTHKGERMDSRKLKIGSMKVPPIRTQHDVMQLILHFTLNC